MCAAQCGTTENIEMKETQVLWTYHATREFAEDSVGRTDRKGKRGRGTPRKRWENDIRQALETSMSSAGRACAKKKRL